MWSTVCGGDLLFLLGVVVVVVVVVVMVVVRNEVARLPCLQPALLLYSLFSVAEVDGIRNHVATEVEIQGWFG